MNKLPLIAKNISGDFFMKISWLKDSNDRKSFKVFESFGAEIQQIDDLEKTDEKIRELIKNNYTTIIMTNEVAGFSENIIKKYSKTNDVKIIIAPPK